MTGNYIEINHKIAFHPGYYLEEYLKSTDLLAEEFSNQIGISEEELGSILKGTGNITLDIARKLSSVIGTSTEYWMNLQKAYDSLVD